MILLLFPKTKSTLFYSDTAKPGAPVPHGLNTIGVRNTPRDSIFCWLWLCCVANVYSTLSPYTCSPLNAYDYAYKEIGHAPTKASAALDWGNISRSLFGRYGNGLRCIIRRTTMQIFSKAGKDQQDDHRPRQQCQHR